ncbi:MAG: type IV secretory system conjugative DNA transfer family protein, partial [Gammaproteobacteria bacterium]|nr:type IV secretory system conjugative DNA transfer family protein [Gammaproteobacteria bacterium]
VPRLSSARRLLRVKQSGEELSDIRTEAGRLKGKRFAPSKYYKSNQFFLGLDDSGKPVYEDDSTWKSWNQKIIGPTQTGKGVFIGVQIDQAIRKGYCAIVIDPKPDKHLKAIMKQACQDTGRNFVELDLNPGHPGQWAPFAGGAPRERRARMYYALSLNDTGKESDFYKAKERSVIDDLLFPKEKVGLSPDPTRPNVEWDWTIGRMLELLDRPAIEDDVRRTLSLLSEWNSIDTFSPDLKRGQAFSVERALLNNDVVYVRASLMDRNILKAASVLIMEMVQELMRLYKNGRPQGSHIFLLIDEVKFMISDQLANALATCVGFDSNISIAYQSILDLQDLDDANVNAKTVENSVNINCKLTLCYQAANAETAMWAEELSGTQLKAVTGGESVKVGRHGVEKWTEERSIVRQEAPIISHNTMLMLPQMVGVLFRPATIATVLYTAWVAVDGVEEIPYISPDTDDAMPIPDMSDGKFDPPPPPAETKKEKQKQTQAQKPQRTKSRQQRDRPSPADRRRQSKGPMHISHKQVTEELERLQRDSDSSSRSKKV